MLPTIDKGRPRNRTWRYVILGVVIFSLLVAGAFGYWIFENLQLPTKVHASPVFVLTGTGNHSVLLSPCPTAMLMPEQIWNCTFTLKNTLSGTVAGNITVSAISEEGFALISTTPAPPQTVLPQASERFSLEMMASNELGDWTPTIIISITM